MSDSRSCIFCRIISGHSQAHRIAETVNFLAFLDHQPITLGHTLIIPKRHCVTLLDVPQEFLGEYLDFTRALAQTVMKELGVPAFNLFQNNGAAAGQVVFHVHFHLVPRDGSDGIRYRRYLTPQSSQEQASLAGRLKIGYETRKRSG